MPHVFPRRFVLVGLSLGIMAPALADGAAPPAAPSAVARSASPTPVVFKPADRSVSTWRAEAAAHLDLTPEAAADLLAGRDKGVARCVKLNNYWCIKKAGWNGEIAADGDGHVAFSSAVEGAAVAALLLKRYYVDFERRTALAIIAHWAPAQCGVTAAGGPATSRKALAPRGLGNTLRARWLASHVRGFAMPVAGKAGAKTAKRSVVADRMPAMMPAPSIAVGLGEKDRPMKPITLDALLQASGGAPRSRSMLGGAASITTCGDDGPRIAAYAAKAAAGIKAGPGDDLMLFDAAGEPTDHLATMMANMARVEIGPLAANADLIKAGIADAFRAGRNPKAK